MLKLTIQNYNGGKGSSEAQKRHSQGLITTDLFRIFVESVTVIHLNH